MKKNSFILPLILFIFLGCATTKNIPEIPMDPISLDGDKKGLIVTLFKINNGAYTIDTTGMKIPSEKKDVAKILTGIEQIGEFSMVYDTKTESFLLLPIE